METDHLQDVCVGDGGVIKAGCVDENNATSVDGAVGVGDIRRA